MLTTIRRLAAWLRRDTLDDQLAEEIEAHLQLRVRSLVADGMSPEKATLEATRRFGNVLAIREESRAMWGFPTIDALVHDVRFGFRLLRRAPAFTAVAALSLAIGIGSAVAVFSLADAILFRKLPVRDPDGLRVVRWVAGPTFPFNSLSGFGQQNETQTSSTSFSLAAFAAIRQQAADVADVIGFGELYHVNIGINGQAELGKALAVSGNYFDVLGVAPHAGRLLTAHDDSRGAPAVAMISHALWQRRLGASNEIIGRAIAINGIPVTVVGVTPRGFGGTLQVGDAVSAFVPLTLAGALERSTEHYDPNHWWVLMMARLKPGVSTERASSSFDALVRQTALANKPELKVTDLPRVVLQAGGRGQTEIRDGLREPLRTMATVVAIVLLVACANVANLLLARGTSRNREIGMRIAIGAPRSRIVGQLITESLLLSLLGCAFGLIVATWLAAGLLPALEQNELFTVALSLDWRALGFALLLAVSATLLFGVVPAFRTARVSVLAGVQEGSRGQAGTARRFGLAGALVSAQIALSLMLVSGAGLLVGSLRNLEKVQTGFDPRNILLFRVNPVLNGYEGERLRALENTILDNVRALPGVLHASMSSHTLIADSSAISDVYVAGHTRTDPSGKPQQSLAWRLNIDDEFFKTMGMTMTTGRGFDAGDSPASQPVAIVNPTFIKRTFGGGDALGRRFRLSRRPGAPEYEIVGVVADARYTGIRRDVPPTVYLSTRQAAPGPVTFEIKTAGDPLALVGSVRAAVSAIEPNLPLADIRTQEAQIAYSLRRERLFARLATALGFVTLALCAMGLYGLLTSAVSRRIPEIGVRMALGAKRWDVRWMVLRQSLLLVAAGVLLGVPAALMSTQLLENLLFGLGGRDPWVLGGAIVVLVAVSAVAAYIPARRASRVDPVVALRV